MPKPRLKLGLDSFAVRAMKWKAPALFDYAAPLKLDTVFISDLDAPGSHEPARVAVFRRLADEGGCEYQPAAVSFFHLCIDQPGRPPLNGRMRMNLVFSIALLAGLAAFSTGCASPRPASAEFSDVPGPSAPVPGADVAATVEQVPLPAPARSEPAPQLIVTPDATLEGRVASVNDPGRFVVLKFPPGRMPALQSTLNVYRQGQKVAELTVTGPQKDDHIVADISGGDCRVADVVRDR